MLLFDRHIAHLDLDSFYVSVERLRNPKLIDKPVLIGGTGDRSVVASCSYEARKFGIHSAMPMRVAQKLCSHAIIINGDMDTYVKYSHLVTDIIKDTVPLFEKASIDEFYVDMTGMDKYFGCMQYIGDLKDRIKKDAGLPISYALSVNKFVSKVATGEVKPNGQIEIPRGTEKSFLAPLSITKLPGIGKKTAQLLIKMGVQTTKTLSEIPMEMLQNLLGKNGVELWQRANGIDTSPVVPYREQKSISTEETFSQDTIDIQFLHTEIVRMTEKVAFEMRSQNKMAGCLTVKLRYSNFETFTMQQSFSYINADRELVKIASALFDRLYNRRMLIRLIGVRLSKLVYGHHQIDLFNDTQAQIHLYQAVDSIKQQFGENILMSAAGLPKKRGKNQ